MGAGSLTIGNNASAVHISLLMSCERLVLVPGWNEVFLLFQDEELFFGSVVFCD